MACAHSKLDVNQIWKAAFDDATDSLKVNITDTEMAVALDKSEDSIAVSHSTDKLVIPVVDGECEVSVIQYEQLYVVAANVTIDMLIGDVVVDTVISDQANKCRLDNILAEKVIIKTTSTEVVLLGR